MPNTKEKRPILRSLRLEIEAESAIVLSRVARSEEASLQKFAAELLDSVALWIVAYQRRYEALDVDGADVPEDLATAVDGLNEMVCDAALMQPILPEQFLRLARVAQRYDQLSQIEDDRVMRPDRSALILPGHEIEVPIPIAWDEEEAI